MLKRNARSIRSWWPPSLPIDPLPIARPPGRAAQLRMRPSTTLVMQSRLNT